MQFLQWLFSWKATAFVAGLIAAGVFARASIDEVGKDPFQMWVMAAFSLGWLCMAVRFAVFGTEEK